MKSRFELATAVALVVLFFWGPWTFAAGERWSAEQVIALLQERGELANVSQASISLFKKHCPASEFKAGAVSLQYFCDVIGGLSVCQQVPPGDRMQCQGDKLPDDIAYAQIPGKCLENVIGGMIEFKDLLIEFVKWIFSEEKGLDKARDAAGDYAESVKLYYMQEYDRTYQQSSSPFRHKKAMKAVAQSILKDLKSEFEKYLTDKYEWYGCLNAQAKANFFCKAVGLLVPPTMAFDLLKKGYKRFLAKPLDGQKLLSQADKQKKFILSEYVKGAAAAGEALHRAISAAEKRAVLQAHLVGLKERGKNGAAAKIGNYTEAQIWRKRKILGEAGFNKEEIRQLMDKGVVGFEDDFSDADFGDDLGGFYEHDRFASQIEDTSFASRDLRDPLRKGDKHEIFGKLTERTRDPYGDKHPSEIFDKYDIFSYEEDMLIHYTRSQSTIYDGSKEDWDYFTSGLEKLPKVKGTVYRGTNLDNDQLAPLVAGGTYEVEAGRVLSTSSQYSVAETFAYDTSGTGHDHRVMFKIKGRSGRSVDFLSDNSGESEILFPPESKFKILKREDRKEAIYFELEEM